MKRTVLEIYALAVCFGSIICLVVALGIATYDVVRIASPGLTLDQYEYNRHQSNDVFWQSDPRQFGYTMSGPDGMMMSEPAKLATGEPKRPAESELTERRTQSLALALKGEVRSALQSLIRTGILIVISTVLFMTHWRLARRAREDAAVSRPAE